MSNEVKKSKRFVISKNGVKNNVTIEFTNKKGETFVYNQSVVFYLLKILLDVILIITVLFVILVIDEHCSFRILNSHQYDFH